MPNWLLKSIKERRKYFVQKNKPGEDYETMSELEQVPQEEGNLVSSWLGETTHAPVIDLDIEHEYVPSKTPGHAHLIIDKEMSAELYKKLLDVLLECGLIQQGFHAQYEKYGATMTWKGGKYKAPKKTSKVTGKPQTLTASANFNPQGDIYTQLLKEQYKNVVKKQWEAVVDNETYEWPVEWTSSTSPKNPEPPF